MCLSEINFIQEIIMLEMYHSINLNYKYILGEFLKIHEVLEKEYSHLIEKWF
jgi:hypothetical protein